MTLFAFVSQVEQAIAEDPGFASRLEQTAQEHEEGTRPKRRARRLIRRNNTRLGRFRMAVRKAYIDVDE